jgi:hypothetical protein
VLVVGFVVAGCDRTGLNRVRPELFVSAEPLDMGTLPVLNEKQAELPLLNFGRAVLMVSSVKPLNAPGAFRIVSAPTEVYSGTTELVVIAFRPPSEGLFQETLRIESDDLEQPQVDVALVGIGSTRAVVNVEPASLDFGRVPECASVVQQVTLTSRGSADLIIEGIEFEAGTSPAFGFIGSTKTPVIVKSGGKGGTLTLTIKAAAPEGSSGPISGALIVHTTDPDSPVLRIPLSATVNRAPVAAIAPLGNGSPGQTVTLDGSSSSDPDADVPLAHKWSLRSKPLESATTILDPQAPTTSMRLDSLVPGAYEVQLDVVDASGVKSCRPERTKVVAAPAEKLLVELFWDNLGTDLDLHILRTTDAAIGSTPDDCFYQNKNPDWGAPGGLDDPQLLHDARTGYGPEIFGYVNPIASTYRVAVRFANELLSPLPSSRATVRIYSYGVLKAELSKTLGAAGELWPVADVTWPSGEVQALP